MIRRAASVLVSGALLVSIAGPALAAGSGAGCGPELDEARGLLEQNEASSAVERLGPLLGRGGLSRDCRSDALAVLAQAQEKLGYYEEAAARWHEILDSGPTGDREIEVLRGVARLERKLGHLPQSIKFLERLAERQPESTAVALDLVETAQAMGDEVGAVRRLMEFREKGLAGIDFDNYQRFNLVDAAVDAVETLLKAGQATPFERMELVRLYQEQGQLDKAIDTGLGLEKEQPASAEIEALLGSLFLARGDLDKSAAYYERSLDLHGETDSTQFLEGLGDVFFQKGERDQAVRLWSRIVRPDGPQVFQRLDLARIYREHGLHDEALRILLDLREDKSVKLPSHLYVRQLADTYYVIGQTQKALEELLGAVEQDPSQIELLEGELQRMLGEDMDVCEPLTQLQSERQSWAGHLFLAQGLEFCGKSREATWNYLQSFLLRNQLDAVATLFAQLVGESRYEEASGLEASLGARSMASVHLLYYRARLAEALGRADQAETLYRDYVAKARRGASTESDRGLVDDAIFHLGCLLLGPLKRPADGGQMLADLIVQFPDSTLRPEAEAKLGLALYRQGQVEEAIRHLDAVGGRVGLATDAKDQTNPLALELLGEIYLAQGDLEKARLTLRTALAQYPDQIGSQQGLLALLQVLRLTEATKEQVAQVAGYRRALLLEDWPAAEAVLLQLAQEEGWKDWARFEMGQLAERRGRRDEAIDLYGGLTAAELPDWLAASAALRLDELLTGAGHLDRAIAVLEKVILDHPKSPRLSELRRKLTDRKAMAALRQQATP
jgi:tetratricopeptide (TPR) repeat protein